MNNGTTPKGAPVQPAKENVAGTGTKNQLINSSGKSNPKKIDRRRFNKGVKGKAGRKKNAEKVIQAVEQADILKEIGEHMLETVEVVIKNRVTGVTYTEKRKTFKALLDTLRDKGLKNQDVAAIKEYFDRTLDRTFGKTAQSIAMKHSGEVGTYTAKRPSKAALAAKKAYASNLED